MISGVRAARGCASGTSAAAIAVSLGCCLAVLSATGCKDKSPDPSLLSEIDRAEQQKRDRLTRAAIYAGRQEHGAIPELVGWLDDDDIAVRKSAIDALRELTGTDLGYHQAMSKSARTAAMERWQALVMTQEEADRFHERTVRVNQMAVDEYKKRSRDNKQDQP